ncbi:hypothetical protein [Actinacidiphila glaucinigra]|uniref:hypothetical protein n=1 Tax=Actinacidiphila glaucinigra TaxID=235986 RepID=UPI002E307F79|nr:hypothetical protein [Actinacidiphila glaucinigra]
MLLGLAQELVRGELTAVDVANEPFEAAARAPEETDFLATAAVYSKGSAPRASARREADSLTVALRKIYGGQSRHWALVSLWFLP